MKKLSLLFILIPLFGIFACSHPSEEQTGHDHMAKDTAAVCCDKDGLLLHISSGYESPHKALMALKMAMMMSKDKDVLLYLDIEAVKLVLKDSKDMKYADFPPLKELLQHLIDAKITIMACPTCLKIAGKTGEDLMPGVIVAEKEKFFNFTKGRIITLDY
jgi:predicted peroxiredoxin